MSDERGSRIRYRSLPALIGGAFVILFALLLVVDTVVRGSGRGAWLSGLGLLLFAGLVYLVSIRPAVIATSDMVVVRNPLQEVRIPWATIDEMRIKYGLDIEAAGDVVHAWAVPGSRGSTQRDLRRRLRSYDADLRAGMVGEDDRVPRRGTGFAERVLEELDLLTEQRKPRKPADSPEPVVRIWAWPWIVPIVVCAVAFVLVLILG